MNGITSLGASYAVAIILVTQIVVSFVINKFGFFGESVIQFSVAKYVGLIIMTIGMLIYQLMG
ncbi:MAG: DMT family transporter [Halanaerobiales bacterium]|nr:DMT family transporter [Halanaerobiales bacterium]